MVRRPSLPLLLLALVVIYGVARLIDPLQRWAAYPVGGDRVEHAIVVYLVVTLVLTLFPRLRLWVPAVAMIGIGVAVELLQALPGVVGGPQLGDVAADVVGVMLAVFPMWLAACRYGAPPD
jgi:hypothetical protein